MAAELGIEPVHLSGHLHALWHTILEQQEDGDLTEWPDSLIASAAMYKGDVQIFCTLLCKYKWLNGRLVHDWLDYAGKYLTAKYRTANPAKLKAIYKRHKSVLSRTKNRSKSAHQPNQPTNQPNQPEVGEGFVLFWKSYPRKVNKELAEKAWKKADVNGSLELVLSALEIQKRSDQWQRDEGKYIPYPATWLNNKRWQDEQETEPQITAELQSDGRTYKLSNGQIMERGAYERKYKTAG